MCREEVDLGLPGRQRQIFLSCVSVCLRAPIAEEVLTNQWDEKECFVGASP